MRKNSILILAIKVYAIYTIAFFCGYFYNTIQNKIVDNFLYSTLIAFVFLLACFLFYFIVKNKKLNKTVKYLNKEIELENIDKWHYKNLVLKAKKKAKKCK